MPTVTFAVSDKVKEEMKEHSWVNWSEVVREQAVNAPSLREELLKKLESDEEKELERWSVELGRKAKKGTWERVLNELPPKERAKLMNKR
jgi:hypothetical protein